MCENPFLWFFLRCITKTNTKSNDKRDFLHTYNSNTLFENSSNFLSVPLETTNQPTFLNSCVQLMLMRRYYLIYFAARIKKIYLCFSFATLVGTLILLSSKAKGTMIYEKTDLLSCNFHTKRLKF